MGVLSPHMNSDVTRVHASTHHLLRRFQSPPPSPLELDRRTLSAWFRLLPWTRNMSLASTQSVMRLVCDCVQTPAASQASLRLGHPTMWCYAESTGPPRRTSSMLEWLALGLKGWRLLRALSLHTFISSASELSEPPR